MVFKYILEVITCKVIHDEQTFTFALHQLLFTRQFALLDFDTVFLCQIFQSFRVAHLLVLHNEVHRIATLTAGKAFAQPFGRRYVERWRLVIMERTQAYIIHTSLAQRNEVRYNVYNLCGIQNSVYGRLVYHWIIVFANAKIKKIPR